MIHCENGTQDAFFNLLEKAHTFEGHSSLKTWIYRIAVNQALMRRRAAGRARERSLESYRKTSRLLKKIDCEEIPEEFRRRLEETLHQRLHAGIDGDGDLQDLVARHLMGAGRVAQLPDMGRHPAGRPFPMENRPEKA